MDSVDQIKEKLTDLVFEIKQIENERDEAILFLRKCQKMSPSAVCDAIDKYITEYDVPF